MQKEHSQWIPQIMRVRQTDFMAEFDAFGDMSLHRHYLPVVKKAYEDSQKPDTKVVMLIPARTDTKYWQDYVMKASEIHFVRGRLKFGDSVNPAPFPSAVIVFDGKGELWRVEGINR